MGHKTLEVNSGLAVSFRSCRQFSETIVSRIPRLWNVKTGWFWAQQRGTKQTGRCYAFRPPEDRNAPRMGLAATSPRVSNAIHVIRQR